METETEQIQVTMPQERAIYGAPIGIDKLPDLLFQDSQMSQEEEVHLVMYLSHFLLTYIESQAREAIEFPLGIPHDKRVILHHV